MADIMSWRDDLIAIGAKRRVTAPGAAKRPKTTDQVAAPNRNGSAAAVDLKQAADTARGDMHYRSVARPSAARPKKANQLPAKATTAAQTAPVRVIAKPVASEAISEQESTNDADAELTAKQEALWRSCWLRKSRLPVKQLPRKLRRTGARPRSSSSKKRSSCSAGSSKKRSSKGFSRR